MTTDIWHIEAPIVAGMQQLTDYDEIAEVLRSRKFLQGAYVTTGPTMWRDTLTMLDGARHLERRRMMGKLFSEEAATAFRAQHLYPVVERTLAEIAAARGRDGVVRADLVPLVQRCLHRIAAAIAGVDGLDEPAAADRFIELVQANAAALTVDWALEAQDAIVQRGWAARAEFRRNFFEPSWKRRRRLVETLPPEELPLDLITLMLAHWNDDWDDELPFREVAVFLVGATQTTAQALVLLVLRLEDWFAKHPDDRRLLVDEPEFLRDAAFESLRMSVAAPARIRTAAEHFVLASGREIRAGESVALLFLPANMDPERFGERPESFDPHRQADEVAPWGLAFGGGAHACLGRPLVTGIRSKATVDGTMVSIAGRLYAAGLELDPELPAVADETTYYDVYTSVPIRFGAL